MILDIDKDACEKFGINERSDLEIAHKIAFVQAQIEEMKRVLWRNRIDLMISVNLSKDDNEMLAAKGQENVTRYKNDIKNFVIALNALNELLDELKEADK